MQESKGRIEKQFQTDDGERQEILNLWREIAWLTDPTLLPRREQASPPNRPLETNHQSIGAVSLAIQEGSHLFSLYPPGFPHFAHDIAADIEYDPTVPPEYKQAVKDRALVWDMIVLARMEQANLVSQGNRANLGFRNANRQSISYLTAFGDALQKVEDDGRIRNYRPDHYVNRRDPCGSLEYTITKESCNVLNRLTDEQLERCNLSKADLKEKANAERIKDLYTLVEWQPDTRKWLITQEVNGYEIDEPIEREVNPYIAAYTRLSEGEHYGRGFLQLRIGDLRAVERLQTAIEDFAGLASKVLWVLDPNYSLRPEDLQKPTGQCVVSEVDEKGTPRGLGVVRLDKLNDFTVVQSTLEYIRAQFGNSSGNLRDSIRNKERVTAYEVQQVQSQTDDLTGGDLSAIDSTLVRPQVNVYRDQCERAGAMKIPDDLKPFMQVNILSGIDAIARRQRGDKLLTLAQVAAAAGDEAIRAVKWGNLFRAWTRYQQPIDQEVIRTDAEVQAEKEAETQAALAANAAATAADVTLNQTGAVVADAARAQLGLTGKQ